MDAMTMRRRQGRDRLFDSVLETVGDTPAIRINRLDPPGVEVYVKAELFNPTGSVKDRLSLSINEGAERDGCLSPGQAVVEATSGNTGIGPAIVCAAKGYPLVVTMADSLLVERRKLMRMMGAKVVLTPRAMKGLGRYRKVVALAEANGWFLARQFGTQVNARIHGNTAAREILADFRDQRLDYRVTGYGTGSTLTGVGRVLRRKGPETKIILTEPANAQLLGSGHVQSRNADSSPAESHPAFQPHPIQGWTPDFITHVLQEALDARLYDELIRVARPEGIAWAQNLAWQEGILTGISGGSTFAVAMNIAERSDPAPSTSACCPIPANAICRRLCSMRSRRT